MTTSVIERWAHCCCSPRRAPTDPCSCPVNYLYSEEVVRDYDWRLEQEFKEKYLAEHNPRAKAERRKQKRKG